MLVLFENEVAVVTRESGFVRARRTSRPLLTRPDAQKLTEGLAPGFRLAVPLRERKGIGLLIDTRDAPLAMTDEAQDPIRPLVDEMIREFSRVAILVQSAVGLLQAVTSLPRAQGLRSLGALGVQRRGRGNAPF